MHTRNQNTVLEGDLLPTNEPNRSNRMLWTLSITVVLAAAVGLGIILRPWTWTGPPDLIVESIRQESEPARPPPQVTQVEPAPPPPQVTQTEPAPAPPQVTQVEPAPPPPQVTQTEPAPAPPQVTQVEPAPPPPQVTQTEPESTPPHRTTIGTWVDRIGRWEHRIEIVATDTSIRRMSSFPNGRTQEAALTEVPPLADERRRFTDSDRRAYAISKQGLLLLFDEGRLVSELAVTGNVDRNAVETLAAGTPAKPNRAEELRAAQYQARIAAAAALEDPRRRATVLLAIVFEQTTAGDLVGARETARQIQDPTRRARAIERIATAEGASPRASDPAPPPAHAETH